jgi:hypothetical protein
MENRFLELDRPVSRQRRRAGSAHAWSTSLSAADRTLVILVENGGVDLGIPELVDKLLQSIPGGDAVPESARRTLVTLLRDKLREVTDNLLETAELTLNRYEAAAPSHYGKVVVLRDGTASYQELKAQLIALADARRIVDVLILTHGSSDFISVVGGIDGTKIRAIKTENGGPLTIRSVYMMNCVGSTLNQAWLDAGAKVSSGAIRNNYLPEPTTYFFWSNWKAGQTFENAVTGAYRRTIALMNETVRAFVRTLPVPGADMLAAMIDFESLDFVKDSAPVIQGQRSVTISSDDLTFAQSRASSLATTVLPISALEGLASSPAAVSAAGLDFLRRWEGTAFSEARVAEVQQLVSSAVKVPLTQQQNDALVSFASNVGADALSRSTLLLRLNAGDYAAVPVELAKWTKGRQNGAVVEVAALVERRHAEAELFSGRPLSLMQNPGVIAGIAVADAAALGLSAVAIVQAQVASTQGAFSLSYDKAQRLLANEARQAMPGAQATKQRYKQRLMDLGIGRIASAYADIHVDWEGNPYGEISTPVFSRNLSTSSEFSRSSANLTITKLDRIPLPNSDPRTWPIVYDYIGTFDPYGNGHFEFAGEFELNAFGGLRFIRHEVVSRSLADWAIFNTPYELVVRGPDIIAPVPEIPKEQMDYLRTKLP